MNDYTLLDDPCSDGLMWGLDLGDGTTHWEIQHRDGRVEILGTLKDMGDAKARARAELDQSARERDELVNRSPWLKSLPRKQ
jgi:hypothetical protein